MTNAMTSSCGDSPAADGGQETLRDGSRVRIRPIRPTDSELERRFIEALSPGARRLRFFETMQSPSAALLKQLTQIDPSRDAAYVAVIEGTTGCNTGASELEIGVARFSAQPDGHDCEFAIAVADAWQNKGLGTLLMRRLIDVASARGIDRMHAISAADNTLMRRLARHFHFEAGRDPDDATQACYRLGLTPTGD